MARDQDRTSLSLDLSDLLADKETAYEFLREYTGLEIADNIRRLREDRDLTQARLAETLGTTQSVVARLEDEGYRRYSLTTLQKIAEAFDLWPTIVFEPYQRVIHRAVANTPATQASVATLSIANFGNLIWLHQRGFQGTVVDASVIRPNVDVAAFSRQIGNREQFVTTAAGINFDTGFIVKEKEPQGGELLLPVPTPNARTSVDIAWQH